MTPTICIYHGNCADGFGAAYAVWKLFGNAVEYHAGVYQQPPPDVAGKNVIMVDFSYKKPVLLEMAKSAKTITILDHHKTAEEDLREFAHEDDMRLSCEVFAHLAEKFQSPAIRAHFDMNKSGAMLAWEYFHPNVPPPKLIEHIQDRDLWRFNLIGTREIQAALFSYPYEFNAWDALMMADPRELHNEGIAIERKHFKDINEFIEVAAYRMTIAGYDVPVLNAPYFYSSDAGHIMAQGEPFAACYWDVPNGERVFSLRSADEGVDVSAVAKRFGGGGHKHAAGFRVRQDQNISSSTV